MVECDRQQQFELIQAQMASMRDEIAALAGKELLREARALNARARLVIDERAASEAEQPASAGS
jgi:hypothetical protein